MLCAASEHTTLVRVRCDSSSRSTCYHNDPQALARDILVLSAHKHSGARVFLSTTHQRQSAHSSNQVFSITNALSISQSHTREHMFTFKYNS